MTSIDIAAMPTTEKLRLMESLWDSFCLEAKNDVNSPAWHGEVLAERLRRIDAGEESVTLWNEAKQRIRAETKTGQ